MTSSNIAQQHGIIIEDDEQPEVGHESNEYTSSMLQIPAVHQVASHYMRVALEEARKSPPKPTNYCVGALLLRAATSITPPSILATGYTLECEGNTHAEQCCFIKLAESLDCDVESLGSRMNGDILLYTTMEPCNQRSVGNLPCVDRILALKTAEGKQTISTVICGVGEPKDLVATNSGRARLEAAGIKVGVLTGMEEEILSVAKAGHPRPQDDREEAPGPSRSNIHNLLN
ncbi:related to RIB2-DRAP deaminase [Ramularia collo-cygni]|uniref:Related to RIB2-DRAP deaminase n=1 Tax=Ramularia collo-cygni TaxID=112498 RepID=A0A2D3USZ1_9PEZI|nr:related to RIB2-DRAP deaminase [Ramularia collo-cygni]CZT14867.1 related to RIB2-DRAP deaminase [Ramularia collo-cygni]